MKNKIILQLYCLLILVLLIDRDAQAQSTEFSYQGSLNVSSQPANDDYDFEFALFDSLGGGAQVGLTLTRSSVPVTDGIFTVELDFGDEFPGAGRWLEIGVRASQAGAYTLLSPRQRMTSTPYAIKSLNAENAMQLGGVMAGDYVVTSDPRLSDARTPTPGSGDYIQNSTTMQTSSNFNIQGTGKANTIDAFQYNIVGLKVLSVPGVNNTYVGIDAGAATAGTDNSFFGKSAGMGIDSGSNNSFFGSFSGNLNSFGNDNSFFGALSGLNNTGHSHSFFGRSAGQLNTTGSSNSFFGRSAGQSNTTGSFNSFFGRDAGKLNTTGFYNSFFGYTAGLSNTNGASNSFFGRRAGQLNQTASHNSFFGAEAGHLNTTGVDNSFFGSGAGKNNKTIESDSGNNNTFIGKDAGHANTIGFRNTAVGAYALALNETGSSNSVFGRFAGNATTGSDNAFFAIFAGLANTTGTRNTFLGKGAGNTNTTGDNNTAMGFNSDVGSSGLSFATAIGAEAIVSDSNTIQLGRSNGLDKVVIFGLGSAGSTPLCRNGSNQVATCSSSIRYKSNLQDFSSGLSLIRQLRAVSFRWKDGGMTDVGLVAEEVARIEPLLTTMNDNGQVEGVKYDRVSVVLVNAVKQQQAEIDRQQDTITVFERKVIEQQAEIDQLKKQNVLVEALRQLVCKENDHAQICT